MSKMGAYFLENFNSIDEDNNEPYIEDFNEYEYLLYDTKIDSDTGYLEYKKEVLNHDKQ